MAESTFLYLTTRGRVSGQPRTIEIWFVQLEGKVYVVAETRERAGWVKNLRADARVVFSIGTRRERGRHTPPTEATARTPDPSAEPALIAKVRAAMDAKHDWSDGLIVELAPR